MLVFLRVLLLTVSILVVDAKVYKRCDLARELVNVHEIPEDQLATWLCILNYESHYNTSAHNKGSGDHGLFQISEMYWCSPPGSSCGVSCDDLKNDDIEDDVICARRIFRQHKRLTGDGFNAWVVYKLHCKDKVHVASFLKGCQLSKLNMDTTNSSTSTVSTTSLSTSTTKTTAPDQPNHEEANKRKARTNSRPPITLRILPQSEAILPNRKKAKKTSKQLYESGNKIPIRVISSEKNFKPMLHIMSSESEKIS